MSDITPTDTADAVIDIVKDAAPLVADIPHLNTVEEYLIEIWHKVHAIEQRLTGHTPTAPSTVVVHQ